MKKGVSAVEVRGQKRGLPPGALVYVGKKRPPKKPRITVIDYGAEAYKEFVAKTIEESFPYKQKKTVTWINIDGLDVDVIRKVGKHYGLHPLLMEDILNTEQRPKIEEFEDHIFVVLKMLWFDEKRNTIESEQMSLVFGKNFLISFQETVGDVFDIVRDRIRKSKGRFRKANSDYLAYALMDTIVDYYFTILEQIGEKVDKIEEELLESPSQRTVQTIHKLKREMLSLRKSVWPLREVIASLQKSESRIINDKTKIYLRDLHDHTIQVIDTIETYRDIVAGMVDVYMSSVSNKLNEVMKVLTVIATIFIPLTFIVGVYGMNFRHFPELEWKYGYAMIWAVMITIAVGMVVFFRRRGWINTTPFERAFWMKK